MMSLVLYVDGWGGSESPAFLQEGCRERVSLSSLVPASQDQTRVMLHWGDTVASLHYLTWQWAKVLGKVKKDIKSEIKKEYKQVKCKICGFVTSLKNQSGHMQRKHPNDYVRTPVTCPLCKIEVESQRSHWKKEHSADVKCNICKKTYPDPARYRQHLKQIHKSPREKEKLSGTCKICNIVYKNVQQHRLRTHGNSKLECDHCDKLFTTSYGLSMHKQYVEGTVKKEQCPECQNFYIKVSDHINTVHRGNKKKKQIKHPKRINTNDIKCGVCDKSFMWKDIPTLNLHIKEKHVLSLFEKLGIKYKPNTKDGLEREDIGKIITETSSTSTGKIQCQLCNKERDTKTRMVDHIKSHLGYKHKRGKNAPANEPYFCQTCGKTLTGNKIAPHKFRCKRRLLRESQSELFPSKCLKCNLRVDPSKTTEHEKVCRKSREGFQNPESDTERCKNCGGTVLQVKMEEHGSLCLGQKRRRENMVAPAVETGTTRSETIPEVGSGGGEACVPVAGQVARVRCPDCCLVIMKKDTEIHNVECQGGPGVLQKVEANREC